VLRFALCVILALRIAHITQQGPDTLTTSLGAGRVCAWRFVTVSCNYCFNQCVGGLDCRTQRRSMLWCALSWCGVF